MPTPEHSQNRHLDFSRQQELVKKLQTRIERAWNSLHQAILVTEELSCALNGIPAEVECVVSTVAKRQKASHCAHHQDYRFFNEGCPELQRIISAVIEQQPDKDEIYRKPSELLEVARLVKALPLKIADIAPEQAEHKRAERAALGRCCEVYKGRAFTVKIGGQDVKVSFDAIAQGRTRRYRFTKRTK